MSTQLPVLDLGRFDSDLAGLVKEAGDAYREYGFCGFSNHGLSDQAVDKAYAAFRRFFKLPLDSKNQYRSSAGGQRGYTPFGIEQARDQTVPDLKEFWHTGREMGADNPWPDILEPNKWPSEVAGFKEGACGLYDALDALGKKILQIIALSLKLERYWFEENVSQGNSVLRAIHYPPIGDRPTSAVRAAQHEDINLITLLIGSNEAGLQILSHEGEWIEVTSIPDTIVVNIGDMMKRLSNHVLPSTPHRVVNPRGAKSQQSRYSTPFFMHPNPDFMIETLESCISAQNPDRYPVPVTANDFLVDRLREIKLM